MIKEKLEELEKATNDVALMFAKKYYYTDDFHWVADDVGGVLNISDDFFELTDIVDYMRYEYPTDKMFEHHQYAQEMWEKEEEDSIICIRDYIKIK
jgi:hypothetical protein